MFLGLVDRSTSLNWTILAIPLKNLLFLFLICWKPSVKPQLSMPTTFCVQERKASLLRRTRKWSLASRSSWRDASPSARKCQSTASYRTSPNRWEYQPGDTTLKQWFDSVPSLCFVFHWDDYRNSVQFSFVSHVKTDLRNIFTCLTKESVLVWVLWVTSFCPSCRNIQSTPSTKSSTWC